MKALQGRTVSVRALTVKYVAGLLLIALLSIAGYAILQQLIVSERASSAIINVSGRQRMLTQKAALVSLRLADSPHPSERAALRAEMANIITMLDEAHHGLVHGNADLGLPGNLSPEVQTLFFGQPLKLEERLHSYFSELNAFVGAADDELTENNLHLANIVALSNILVDGLNLVVNQFQKESEARMSQMQALQAGVLTVMITVLVLEALFIFQPAVLAIRREAEELAAVNRELEELSNADGLTGIANRRYFNEFIGREWQRASRQSQPLTVIMIDIDHFKNYNDTYGHLAGDDCLRQVAALLRDNIERSTDLAARYGGEEFVVVLPDTGFSGAAKVAGRLRAAIEALGIEHTASPVSRVVTASLGVATLIPTPGGKVDDIVALADAALYQAKQRGRNRCVFGDYAAAY